MNYLLAGKSFSSPLSRCALFAVVLLLLFFFASCMPGFQLRTGRVFFAKDDGWRGNNLKARLLGIEEIYHRDYKYLGAYMVFVYLSVENQGSDPYYFSVVPVKEFRRDGIDLRWKEKALPEIDPGQRAAYLTKKAGSTAGLFRLQIDYKDLQQSEYLLKKYGGYDLAHAICTKVYSPAGPGVFPAEGQGVWLWPAEKRKLKIMCTLPNATVPGTLHYGDWSIPINDGVMYSQDNNDLLEDLEFKRPISVEFKDRVP